MHRNTLAAVCAAFLLGPLAHAQFATGKNLVANGDAERGPGTSSATPTTIPGWTSLSGGPKVLIYASNDLLNATSIGPQDRGANYFAGGNGAATTTLSQKIDLTAGAQQIDMGTLTYDFSAYLGGGSSDSAQAGLVFSDGAGKQLAVAALGPVIETDRAAEGLYFRRQIGPVPTGARSATVTVQLNRTSGSSNDGGADNLSLILNIPGQGAGLTLIGSNLIVNSGAEIGTPGSTDGIALDVPSWVRTAYFSTDSYTDEGGDLSPTTPGPTDRGTAYFWGGSGEQQSAYQDIDLSSTSSLIDKGGVTYNLSAWIGGYADQNDNSTITVQFMDWTGKVLGSGSSGPVLAVDRSNESSLLQRSASGPVPSGTKMARITITIVRTDGSDNDGLADNLSLRLSAPGITGVPGINAVVSASAFGGFTTIAPGTWVEIYGTNLSSTTNTWSGSDFKNGVGPVSLSGVSVTIGGKQAFLDYVSSNQVNALIPSDVGPGPQQITLTNSAGTSAAFPITVNSVQPGLLAPSSFQVSGTQYVVALFPDNSTFVLPTGAISDVASRPAKPGDVITLYGIGFGPTTPSIPAGTIVTQTNSLQTRPTIAFGGTPATLQYYGLAPNYTGLYQFNVVVPNIPANSAAPVTLNLGGTSGTQILYIAVGQ
jgi:uncharacterized protein (TIGR03437 family)